MPKEYEATIGAACRSLDYSTPAAENLKELPAYQTAKLQRRLVRKDRRKRLGRRCLKLRAGQGLYKMAPYEL